MTLETIITIDNMSEVKEYLDQFPPILKEEVFRSFQRLAFTKDKELKASADFNDRTGRSRRSLFVVATYNPLGLEMGSYLPHMKYLAYGHGTWRGGWWEKWKRQSTAQIVERITNTVKRAVNKFNRMFKGG